MSSDIPEVDLEITDGLPNSADEEGKIQEYPDIRDVIAERNLGPMAGSSSGSCSGGPTEDRG